MSEETKEQTNAESQIVEVEAQATVDNQPTDDKPVKIAGVAYSGSPIRQFWSPYEMVIDLSGMSFAPQIPLMDSHNDRLLDRLGVVKAKVVNNKLEIEGEFTNTSDYAKNIIEQGKKAKWQLSIGANIKERLFLDENTKKNVNGTVVTGPIYVVTKSLLREVSVVAIGADRDTEMSIAASFSLFDGITSKGETTMPEDITLNGAPAPQAEQTQTQPTAPTAPENKVEAQAQQVDEDAIRAAATEAERARVVEIEAICGEDAKDLVATAVKEGWDANKTRQAVLDKIRASRPVIPNVNVKANAKNTEQILECALAIRCGLDVVKAGYAEPVIEAAQKGADISLKDMFKEVIKLNGGTPSAFGFDNSDIRAAFSTVTLPTLLSNVANKQLLRAYNSYERVAPRLCSEGTLVDFKPTTRVRLVDVGDLQKVGADGEIKHGTLDEETATNQAETYAKSLCLTRQMIINDDLGAFYSIPSKMGAKAARLPDKLFFSEMQANNNWNDGNALFSAAHNNFLTGATSALSKDSLAQAVKLFKLQKDKDGEPIAIAPRILLVPPAKETLALELVRGITLIAAGSTDVVRPAMNALANLNLEVISSPWLTNDNAWYLFGNPAEVDTFEIGYLKGRRVPVIEQGETDFNTLGMWFRVYFDCGVAPMDFRGMVKANGAA